MPTTRPSPASDPLFPLASYLLLLLLAAACADHHDNGQPPPPPTPAPPVSPYVAGPEHPLDASAVLVPAAGDQTAPALASDGDAFYLAWHDVTEFSARTAGTRIGRDGSIAAPEGDTLT